MTLCALTGKRRDLDRGRTLPKPVRPCALCAYKSACRAHSYIRRAGFGVLSAPSAPFCALCTPGRTFKNRGNGDAR
jgi:hypothetical protein